MMMPRANRQATDPSKTMSGIGRAFRRIRLELARDSLHPSGDRHSGYVFVAPLDDGGRIDARLWSLHRDECRVVRFRPDDEDIGHLVLRPDGEWAFRYDVDGDEADETGFRFNEERFISGEYVSIQEDDVMRTFKILSVEHV